VKEWNDEIIFVRQVTPGASERSFGIQVARLAGLPDGVVGRAKQILAGLEAEDGTIPVDNESMTDSASPENDPVEKPIGLPKKRRVSPKIDPSQLELF